MNSYGPQDQRNPYSTAASPGAYAGSGYGEYGGPGPMSPGVGDPQRGMYSGVPPGPMDGMSPGGDKSYQNFTESGENIITLASKIDSETGRPAKKLTDGVCIPAFCLHIIIMIIIACVCVRLGQPSRLSRGFDYQARLCGVDKDESGKTLGPYLYFCRKDANERTPAVLALNLKYPICIDECPSDNSRNYSCLQQPSFWQSGVAPAAVGSLGASTFNFVHVQLTQARTFSYKTSSLGGRYCLPDFEDDSLKYEVLSGPVHFWKRILNGVGSVEAVGCWVIIFVTCLIALVLGYIYVSFFRVCGKYIMILSLLLIAMITGIFGLFFGLAPLVNVPHWGQDERVEENYIFKNPFFMRNDFLTGSIISCLVGILLLVFCVGTCRTLLGVSHDHTTYEDLVHVSWHSVNSTRELLLLPAIEALVRFFVILILAKNFIYVITIGWVDSRLIKVNGNEYKGPTAEYHFDTNYWPSVVYYIFGSIWILELITSFTQFILTSAAQEYYYIAKIDGEKHPQPNHHPLVYGVLDAVRYHLGSLILFALLIVPIRLVRIVGFLLWGLRPSEHPDEDAGGFNGCCGCWCVRFNCVERLAQGIWTTISMHALNDVAFHSSHFRDAGPAAIKILCSTSLCKKHLGSMRIVTIVGVSFIGCVSAVIAYSACEFWWPSLNLDPVFVACLAFYMSGCIAYSYLAMLDVTTDTLLFSYAWNKKFKKSTCEKYIPDELRNAVGTSDLATDSFPLYGDAAPNMYLGSWLALDEPGKKANEPYHRPSPLPSERTDYGGVYGTQAANAPGAPYPGGPYGGPGASYPGGPGASYGGGPAYGGYGPPAGH